MPRFSVIIPTYNRCLRLQQALDSVWMQTFRDFEVIVVDDGSTDDTEHYLLSQLDKLKVVRQTNAGPGAARNAGAKIATGEYLAFLDSDDLWFPWTLETFEMAATRADKPAMMVGSVVEKQLSDSDSLTNERYPTPESVSNPLGQKPEEGLDTATGSVHARILVQHQMDETFAKFGVPESGLKIKTYADFFATSDTSIHFGAGMGVVRSDVFQRVGGFSDEIRVAEDHNLSMHIGTEAGFVKIESPPTLCYQRHSGGVTGALEETLKGMIYLAECELSGAYPGGRKRRRERQRMICRHVRPVVLHALRHGSKSKAWKLLWLTLPWQLSDGRFRFIAASLAYSLIYPSSTTLIPSQKEHANESIQ